MTTPLEKYDIEQLANASLTSAPNYSGNQAVLIGKCLLDLKESIIVLQKQIPKTGMEIRGSMKASADILARSVSTLNTNIAAFTVSNDKYSNTMKWLTIGLVSFAAVQALAVVAELFIN